MAPVSRHLCTDCLDRHFLKRSQQHNYFTVQSNYYYYKAKSIHYCTSLHYLPTVNSICFVWSVKNYFWIVSTPDPKYSDWSGHYLFIYFVNCNYIISIRAKHSPHCFLRALSQIAGRRASLRPLGRVQFLEQSNTPKQLFLRIATLWLLVLRMAQPETWRRASTEFSGYT